MTEEKNNGPAPSPEADKTSNKEGYLGDIGVEALQRLLMMASDNQKTLQELKAQLTAHIAQETQTMMAGQPGQAQGMANPIPPNPAQSNFQPAQAPGQAQAPPQAGQAPPHQEPDGDEKKEEKKDDKKDDDKKSDKSIVPPIPPTTPEAKGELPKLENLSNKAKELDEVREIQKKQVKAMTEGTSTPRPESALSDKGGQVKDGLQELLFTEEGQEKLRRMSLVDVERNVVQKAIRGEL